MAASSSQAILGVGFCGCDGAGSSSVEASDVLDGTYLSKLAAENASSFSGVVARSEPPQTQLTWGTICSGGEVLIFIMSTMKELYKSFNLDLNSTHRFSCEIKPNVQDWIKSVAQESGECNPDYCLFERAEQMGSEVTKCVRHGKFCPVPAVDLLIFGTSCKGINRASNVYRATNLVMAKQNSVGGSAQTFGGCMKYLHNHVVHIMLFENVDALDDAGDLTNHQTNLSIVVENFTECGFAVKVFLMDCSLFGLPQSRRRYYVLGLKEEGAAIFDFADQGAQAILNQTEQLVRLCQRVPPCATQLLTSDDDPSVDVD